jgi:F-type H+-transporting ATPase subunit delta
MREGRVAKRYAEALLRAAADEKTEEIVAKDLESLRASIEASRDLQLLLKSPVIKRDKKKEVLHALFEGNVSGTTLSFLHLVAEKGRESALPSIIQRFMEIRNEKLGILTVDVTAVSDLSTDQMQALKDRFAALTKKTILMNLSFDAALKGGFRARVGDTVFDGSIQRQLEIMRQRFFEADGSN